MSGVNSAVGPYPKAGELAVVQAVFEQLPHMVCAFQGSEMRFVAANAAYRAFSERDDMVGKGILEAVPEVGDQHFTKFLREVMASGRPASLRDWRGRIKVPDTGEWREFFVDFTLLPFRTPDGEVSGVIVDLVDVTDRVLERRAAQERTAEAERRFAQARNVIDMLQRQLLPPGLPVLPRVDLAAAYLPADADTSAGGDWFDAVVLPGGRVALVVGDVVGHGVAASAAMGQLRAVIQDRLDETGDVLAAIAAADRMAGRVPDAHAATVCVVVLDPADGTLTGCSAGHPPPLIAGPDNARLLAVAPHGPLGTGARYTTWADRLGPDELVLLYTDGIIERPGRTPSTSVAELFEVVRRAVAGRGLDAGAGLSTAEQVCAQTLELLLRQTGHSDDVTLLAARRRTPVPPLRLAAPSATTSMNVVRAAVRAWAVDVHVGRADVEALTHAAVELVANACEHARPGAGDITITVTASVEEDGMARLSVEDSGRWCERAAEEDRCRPARGYGLALARSFADYFEVDRGREGTTVTVRRRLSRSARLLTLDLINYGGVVTEPDELIIVAEPDTPSRRIAISGPLDGSTVDQLRAELDRRTHGGTHDLVVDLSGVTHLASSAVAELFRPRPGNALTLYAPAGSTARHVLTLVDLPHTTDNPR
ncbi:SpoIIE family protein phosphatase [Actinoplanes sp. HUAS TT8]|uniref:SpoIIE family protein phosphatase n=1 Tax=Actinoplanes sp. HUAS TT8 TaxID=3447453 RepID=UPI003F525420